MKPPPSLALLALAGAFLLQNLAEAWEGGPTLPDRLITLLPTHPQAIAALALIFGLGLLPLLLAWGWQTRFSFALLAAVSDVLAANALLQPLISLQTGAGWLASGVGLALMLPASLWAFRNVTSVLGLPKTLFAGLCGLTSAPILLMGV